MFYLAQTSCHFGAQNEQKVEGRVVQEKKGGGILSRCCGGPRLLGWTGRGCARYGGYPGRGKEKGKKKGRVAERGEVFPGVSLGSIFPCGSCSCVSRAQ